MLKYNWRTFVVAGLLAVLFFAHMPAAAGQVGTPVSLVLDENSARLRAGLLERRIERRETGIRCSELNVGGTNVLSAPGSEFALTFTFADPDKEPDGISDESITGVLQSNASANNTDALNVQEGDASNTLQQVRWTNPVRVEAAKCREWFEGPLWYTHAVKPGRDLLNIRFVGRDGGPLAEVSIDIYYHVDASYPAIRKWIEITNNGCHWLKVEALTIDGCVPAKSFNTRTELTPAGRGAGASVVAFSNDTRSRGVIAASEVPSALRDISQDGVMGYNNDLFEWVLGPSEQFTSEPVFHFAFDGETYKTISAVSTSLDRVVEGPFITYLENVIGVSARPEDAPVPLWCTWSNFGPKVDDAIIREMADAAASAGFAGLQIDAGWAKSEGYENWDCGNAEPSPVKFPDFEATCAYIRGKGLKLGLWISCFRMPGAKDFAALPNAFCLPLVRRGEGVGMSYASPWRAYYANDIVALADRYGAVYFKQDLTNLKYGDINAVHESRTRKGSYLRTLRGLLESQRLIHERAPDVHLLLSHEIYWGTPGVPCDLAAIKSTDTFHIPPNDYSGCGPRKSRVVEFGNDVVSEKLRRELLQGCLNAREQFYAHRGLPLYCLEYYGAATVDWQGSLTPAIQDRQVCSWLMGVPSVYAGDLASLSPEQLAHYDNCFAILKDLQARYDIYRHFQFSGVPKPTDRDWHWWGKLNADGSGAVVVLRGAKGEDQRAINIPWVCPEKRYRIISRFTGATLGDFTGTELQNGALKLSLAPMGQDILELAAQPGAEQ